MKYCIKVIENVVKNASNKHVCDNDNRIDGLMYCAYKSENLLNSEIKHLVELFEIHDQIFVLNEGKVYKFHLTKG